MGDLKRHQIDYIREKLEAHKAALAHQEGAESLAQFNERQIAVGQTELALLTAVRAAAFRDLLDAAEVACAQPAPDTAFREAVLEAMAAWSALAEEIDVEDAIQSCIAADDLIRPVAERWYAATNRVESMLASTPVGEWLPPGVQTGARGFHWLCDVHGNHVFRKWLPDNMWDSSDYELYRVWSVPLPVYPDPTPPPPHDSVPEVQGGVE